MAEKLRKNRERQTRHFTRFHNQDGSHEDIEDKSSRRGFASPLGDVYMTDEERHLDKAQGRPFERIYRIVGIIGRKFVTDKVGGNGWSYGMGSEVREVEGPDVGRRYRAIIGGGVTFEEEEPQSVREKS